MMLLEIKGISKQFGGLHALKDLDIEIGKGEIFGLIGPNGSGKTTLLNIITGFLKPDKGGVVYKCEQIVGLNPNELAKRGIVRTFQITSIFPDLTAKENVITASYLKTNDGIWASFFRTRNHWKKEMKLSEKAEEILEFLKMWGARDTLAQELTASQQRKLGIALALAVDPELLLLDEPGVGLNSEEQLNLIELIKKINQKGTTIGIVDHNMKIIMGLCTRIATLDHGCKIAEGTPEEIVNDANVISIYLGPRKDNA